MYVIMLSMKPLFFHRYVCGLITHTMHHLKVSSQVFSIGRGIIGSAAEENSRKHVNWTQHSCYLLPASKGIACGYIHKPAAVDVDTKSESTKMNGDG